MCTIDIIYDGLHVIKIFFNEALELINKNYRVVFILGFKLYLQGAFIMEFYVFFKNYISRYFRRLNWK